MDANDAETRVKTESGVTSSIRIGAIVIEIIRLIDGKGMLIPLIT